MHANPASAPPRPPLKPPRARPGILLLNFLITTPLGALFPRVQRLLYWPARERPRAVAASIALHAAAFLGMDAIARAADKHARERAAIGERLREELGRPPWPGEIENAWREDHGWPPYPDEPTR
jgi:hypothetical protein